MRIIITGGLGQLGQALQSVLIEHDLAILDLPEVDITDFQVIEKAFSHIRPNLVIHCAALTDVDRCARQPELAYRVNGLGTQNVALACRTHGAEMVHISTNEVFAGDNPSGYEEWMPPHPINEYGRSKAFAEAHVQANLTNFYIVRTAWLYAPGGHNFIHAILERARKSGRLRVVTDEIGNPTYVKDLAVAISQLIITGRYGTYHLINEGSCSRWEFANEILKLAGLTAVTNEPILTKDFSRASIPPLYAALHNRVGSAQGITLRNWPEALAEYMAQYT
ncbi:MAG TPA: dTDP-4-dehydrorhamnose reductase [Patescibacteria group bacterium]|nr:dTDP-4-dehydrorhamnose reductase [Patescibacteria group bacterium]